MFRNVCMQFQIAHTLGDLIMGALYSYFLWKGSNVCVRLLFLFCLKTVQMVKKLSGATEATDQAVGVNLGISGVLQDKLEIRQAACQICLLVSHFSCNSIPTPTPFSFSLWVFTDVDRLQETFDHFLHHGSLLSLVFLFFLLPPPCRESDEITVSRWPAFDLGRDGQSSFKKKRN